MCLVRLVLFAFSYNVPMLYVANLIGTPVTLLVSTIRSVMSKIVSDQDYRKVFSLASCVDTIANMIGSVLILYFYRKTADALTSSGYLFIAFLYITVLILLIYMHKVTLEDRSDGAKPGANVPLKNVLENEKSYHTVDSDTKSFDENKNH